MDGNLQQPQMRDGTLERRRALLHDAIALIVSNHGPAIDLDSVAHAIGTSRRQLQRVFNELSERSFRDTLAAVRMGHARTLLSTTDRPIGEIARIVGYADPAQFTKAFRHHHAMAPRQFRQAHRATNGASPE